MNKLTYVFITIIVLLSLLPLLNNTFFRVHDFTHVARLVEMDLALKDGHFPVRWARDFAYGYGMPLFSFYGPLPSYLAEAFHLTGFSMITSIKLLLIGMTLGGAVGMYEFTKRLFGRAGGVLSTIVFSFVPYRAIDLYVRGAFNELFALCLVPWILVAILKLRDSATTTKLCVTAIFLSLLFVTHNLMTMMFVPLIYACALFLAIGAKQKKRFLLAFHLALALAVLAASFFLLPSYLEKNYTQVDALIGGYSYFKFHFLYIRQLFSGNWGYGGSILGPDDGISFSFGWAVWLLSAMGFFAWFLKKKKPVDKLFPLFFAAVSGAALFMTLTRSTFIWESIPVLAYFQFPWRFLSVPTVLLPILAGGTVLLFRSRKLRVAWVVLATVIICVLNIQYFKPQELLRDANSVYPVDRQHIQVETSRILPDYIPASMKVIQEPLQSEFSFDQSDEKVAVLVDRTQERLLQFTLKDTHTEVPRHQHSSDFAHGILASTPRSMQR